MMKQSSILQRIIRLKKKCWMWIMSIWKYCWIQIVFFVSVFALLVACFELTDIWFTPWWVSSLIFLFSLIALTVVLSYWLFAYGDREDNRYNDEEKEHLIYQFPSQRLMSLSSMKKDVGISNLQIQNYWFHCFSNNHQLLAIHSYALL